MQHEYTLQVTKDQLRTLQQACELMTRIYLGQLDHIANIFLGKLDGEDTQDSIERYLELQEKLARLKPLATGMSRNASFGVGNDKVNPQHRISYEMAGTIRRFLAYEANPNGDRFSCLYDEPLKISNQPLPIINKNDCISIPSP